MELSQMCTKYFQGFSELKPEQKDAILKWTRRLRSVLIQMRFLHKVDPIQMWIPFPKQAKLLRAIKKFIFFLGSNRPGKTEWLVADCAMYSEARHPFVETPKNARCYFSVLDYKKLERVILPKFQTKLRPGYYEINQTDMCITITKGAGKGNKIFLMSQEAGRDAYESFSAHRFYVDEEHAEDIFTAIMARCIDYNASILLAATPTEGLTWLWHKYWSLYRQGKMREELHIEEATMYDNPTLDPKLIDKLYERMSAADPLMARVRVYGEPLNLSGTPFFNLLELNGAIKEADSVFHEVGELEEVA